MWDLGTLWETLAGDGGPGPGVPAVDVEQMRRDGLAALAELEAAREAHAAARAADRQRGREAYERANREFYGQQRTGLTVAASAWAWADPPPLQVW